MSSGQVHLNKLCTVPTLVSLVCPFVFYFAVCIICQQLSFWLVWPPEVQEWAEELFDSCSASCTHACVCAYAEARATLRMREEEAVALRARSDATQEEVTSLSEQVGVAEKVGWCCDVQMQRGCACA
jgi:hypothetical protein